MLTVRSIFALLILHFLTGPVWPQSRACAPRGQMVDRLEKTFQETPRAFGLIGGRAVVELFVSGLGSWTIIVTGTSGKSCMLASGEGWENIPLIIGEEL